MNEVVNSGVMNIASLVVSVVVLLIGLILWFFINRASSRTNEQIELLEALLDQQKRQNALLPFRRSSSSSCVSWTKKCFV